MKIQFQAPTSETCYLIVCDRCGYPSDPDDILKDTDIPGIGKTQLHGRCLNVVKDRIRQSYGLKTQSEIDTMRRNGRYSSIIPS